VAAANEVIKLGCEYDLTNPQWSTDFQAHMRWCRFAEQGSVDQEKANRASQLNHCKSCADYAVKAVGTANELNKIKVCVQNPGDPRWSTDQAAHRKWCLQANDDSVSTEASARNNERFYCLSCVSYAQKAVNQYERAKACLGSAPSGQQWSPRFTDHYYWCRDRWLSDTPNETAKRDNEIARFCTQTTRKGLSTSTSSVAIPRRIDPARPRSESNDSIEGKVRAANPCQPGRVTDPCKSKSRILSPGLLEADGGLGTQGPTPGTPAGGRGGAPAGDSLRLR